jgi:hypothetical protein
MLCDIEPWLAADEPRPGGELRSHRDPNCICSLPLNQTPHRRNVFALTIPSLLRSAATRRHERRGDAVIAGRLGEWADRGELEPGGGGFVLRKARVNA